MCCETQGNPVDCKAVFYVAIVKLVSDSLDGVQVPETLLLDTRRLHTLRVHFHAGVLSAIIIATVVVWCRQYVTDVRIYESVVKSVQKIALRHHHQAIDLTVLAVKLEMSMTLMHILSEGPDGFDPVYLTHLQLVLDKNVCRTSSVYMAMAKIFKNVWYHLTREDTIVADIAPACRMPEYARVSLLSPIGKAPKRLSRMRDKKLNLKRRS
jgi:hypothetical protein